MDVDIIKIGGGILHNRSCFSKAVLNVKQKRNDRKIIIVMSALYGVTDFLVENGDEVANGKIEPADVMRDLKQRHNDYFKSIEDEKIQAEAKQKLETAL